MCFTHVLMNAVDPSDALLKEEETETEIKSIQFITVTRTASRVSADRVWRAVEVLF